MEGFGPTISACEQAIATIENKNLDNQIGSVPHVYNSLQDLNLDVYYVSRRKKDHKREGWDGAWCTEKKTLFKIKCFTLQLFWANTELERKMEEKVCKTSYKMFHIFCWITIKNIFKLP